MFRSSGRNNRPWVVSLLTIHSSLAIENNSLSLEQMTDIINGKRVLGSPNEIREVKNAFDAYSLMLTFDPFNIEDIEACK